MNREEGKQCCGVNITEEQCRAITDAVLAEVRQKVLDIVFKKLESDVDEAAEIIKRIVDEIEHEGRDDANNQKCSGQNTHGAGAL